MSPTWWRWLQLQAKNTQFETKIVKIYTKFQTKTAQKPYYMYVGFTYQIVALDIPGSWWEYPQVVTTSKEFPIVLTNQKMIENCSSTNVSFVLQLQSHSQSPRYPYSAAGTGNKDLWDKVFRHDRILGNPVHVYICPFELLNHWTSTWTSGLLRISWQNTLSQRSLLPIPTAG